MAQLREAQLGQLEDSLNQLQGELKSSGEARRSVEAEVGAVAWGYLTLSLSLSIYMFIYKCICVSIGKAKP